MLLIINLCSAGMFLVTNNLIVENLKYIGYVYISLPFFLDPFLISMLLKVIFNEKV